MNQDQKEGNGKYPHGFALSEQVCDLHPKYFILRFREGEGGRKIGTYLVCATDKVNTDPVSRVSPTFNVVLARSKHSASQR